MVGHVQHPNIQGEQQSRKKSLQQMRIKKLKLLLYITNANLRKTHYADF